MPANLTPQYLEAERNFRNAKTTQEKIAWLEEMLAVMPKHKGTDHLRADLRTKIANLTKSLDKRAATARSTTKIEKAGAAQVAVIGPPNTGKSQIVAALTNAKPTVAAYPYTTQAATPGTMHYENVQIQLVDTPPIGEQPPEWWLLNIIRRADALLIVVDLSQDAFTQTDSLLTLLKEKNIGIGKSEEPEDEESPISYKKTLLIANKNDLDPDGSNFRDLQEMYGELLPVIAVNAASGNLDELKKQIFQMLDVIRVYTKTPGSKPDMTEPIILERGSTLEMAAVAIHKSFGQRMKYARVWGSGKFDGVMVKRDHVLQDGDIIELHV
ncbi:MAG: 50S ribosome-binding GTPase [Dehalococcoidales bacterium]|nr:50S ribosome-binding GTPase [Dehalococcoidales bacterium]